jgi:hypothetical protein
MFFIWQLLCERCVITADDSISFAHVQLIHPQVCFSPYEFLCYVSCWKIAAIFLKNFLPLKPCSVHLASVKKMVIIHLNQWWLLNWKCTSWSEDPAARDSNLLVRSDWTSEHSGFWKIPIDLQYMKFFILPNFVYSFLQIVEQAHNFQLAHCSWSMVFSMIFEIYIQYSKTISLKYKLNLASNNEISQNINKFCQKSRISYNELRNTKYTNSGDKNQV